MSFAPEAQRILAGGGAERNRRNRAEIYSGAPEGRQTSFGLPPLRGSRVLGSRSRRFHRRLISGVPPGRRASPDLCRNSSCLVCAASIIGCSIDLRKLDS